MCITWIARIPWTTNMIHYLYVVKRCIRNPNKNLRILILYSYHNGAQISKMYMLYFRLKIIFSSIASFPHFYFLFNLYPSPSPFPSTGYTTYQNDTHIAKNKIIRETIFSIAFFSQFYFLFNFYPSHAGPSRFPGIPPTYSARGAS